MFTKRIEENTINSSLREKAEDRLQVDEKDRSAPEPAIDTEMRRMVHELQIYRIELEIQNTELEQTKSELEAERENYKELYDFAPIGYLTLDQQGVIHKSNLFAAGLFGMDRSGLIDRRLGFFIPEQERFGFNAFLQQIFESGSEKTRELTLITANREAMIVRFDATLSKDGRSLHAVLTDITKQKKTEEDLRKSEITYRTIFENTGMPMSISDENTVISEINSEFEHLFGYKREELSGNSWTRYVRKEDLERLMGYHNQRLIDPASVPKNYELKLVCRTGDIRDIYVTVARIPGTMKNVASYLDITQLKETEKALKESEMHYRLLFKHAGVGIVITNRAGKFQEFNDTFLDFIGYSPEELRKMTPADITAPEYIEQTSDLKAQQLKGELDEINLEKRFIRKDGTERWGQLRSVGIRDEQGNMLMTVATLTDTTGRKTAEQNLAKNEALYRHLFESAFIGMFQITLDGELLLANKAFASMFGYETPEEMISDTVSQIHIPPENLEELLSGLDRQQWINIENSFLRKDGCSMVGRMGVRKVNGLDGIVYLEGIMEDITERRRAEEELKINAKNLLESNTTLKVLLNTMERDQEELKDRFLDNIKAQVLPYLNELRRTPLSDLQQSLIDQTEANLDEIASPFVQKLTSNYLNLTKKEVQIAALIKEGKTSKEIAQLLNSKQRAIEFHRENIRKKLGLKNRKKNLSISLRSLA